MSERKANVLIVDFSTGRSSALADAYLHDSNVGKVILTSKNDIAQSLYGPNKVEVYPMVRPDDPIAISQLAEFRQVDLVDIAQDVSVRAGVANRLREIGVLTIGPKAFAGKLEWDKIHGRRFAKRNGLPQPTYLAFDDAEAAIRFLDILPSDTQVVIKGYGLCEGKGVDVADNIEEAKRGVDRIVNLPNRAGERFLIEERVGGTNSFEFSAFYLGTNYKREQEFRLLGFAKDYKRVFDGDRGPNTGGMGSISFDGLLEEALQERVFTEIVQPTAAGLEVINHPYRGVLYIGGMYDPDINQIWLIEYNCRWGDPEAEVIVSNLAANNSFLELSYVAANGGFNFTQPNFSVHRDNKFRVSVAGCSLGYPADYQQVKGKKIEGLDQVIKRGDVKTYGAGVIMEDGQFYANGGRLFHLVAEGDTLENARKTVYQEIDKIHIPGDNPGEDLIHYRMEIGH